MGAKPRRTIRVALWDGEEHEDYWGSMGYVKKHFGDYKTGATKPEHAKLSAYFNVDNGTGKIRGLYLQGNEAVRPIFAPGLVMSRPEMEESGSGDQRDRAPSDR